MSLGLHTRITGYQRHINTVFICILGYIHELRLPETHKHSSYMSLGLHTRITGYQRHINTVFICLLGYIHELIQQSGHN